jgi:hypothetical protein
MIPTSGKARSAVGISFVSTILSQQHRADVAFLHCVMECAVLGWGINVTAKYLFENIILLNLWLSPYIKTHVAVGLGNRDFTSSVCIRIFFNELHCL